MAGSKGFVPHALDRPGLVQAALANETESRSDLSEGYMENSKMISTNKSKVIVLAPYMEVIGPFIDLEEQEDVLLAEIGRHSVVLPLELKEALSNHLGHRIAILRTYIPGKEYLFRVLSEKEPEPKQENGQMFTNSPCKDEQMPSCSEVT
jgi:hypothetical protein